MAETNKAEPPRPALAGDDSHRDDAPAAAREQNVTSPPPYPPPGAESAATPERHGSSAIGPYCRWNRGELILPAVVVFLLALPTFSRISGAGGSNSDTQGHIDLALRIVRDNYVVPHPLFHVCLLYLTGGDNPSVAIGMTAFLLAAALAVRAYLSALLFTSHSTVPRRTLVLLCLALALAMPLPNWWKFPAIYLGQVSPNVWHNPTTVFAMPFALGLFLAGTRALETPRLSTMALAGAAMVLSLLAKPNYVMAFAPCFGVLLPGVLFRAVRSGQATAGNAAGQLLVAFGPVLAVILWQYLSWFGTPASEGNRVILAPLSVWSRQTPNVAVSILLGIAFPLAVVVCYPAQVNRDAKVVLAWAVLAVALFTYGAVYESGKRLAHGNFGWGMILADQVLFVASCNLLVRQTRSARRSVAYGVLGLQVAAGAVYLICCLILPVEATLF